MTCHKHIHKHHHHCCRWHRETPHYFVSQHYHDEKKIDRFGLYGAVIGFFTGLIAGGLMAGLIGLLAGILLGAVIGRIIVIFQ